jgi:hypothetical protein
MIPLRLFTLIAPVAASLGLFACAPTSTPACYPSHHPDDTQAPEMCHYPVARQGKLTAWLTSDHRRAAGDWLYSPADSSIRHRIVGVIPGGAMPSSPQHDGAFLLTADYDGPLFQLWEGTEATGLLYSGRTQGWLPVQIYQGNVINTWVKLHGSLTIGGWSGYPVIIGEPARPEFVAGAMWYRSNSRPSEGGATSTRLLKIWLGRLKFADFVKPEAG